MELENLRNSPKFRYEKNFVFIKLESKKLCFYLVRIQKS